MGCLSSSEQLVPPDRNFEQAGAILRGPYRGSGRWSTRHPEPPRGDRRCIDALEDKLDALEKSTSLDTTLISRRRKASTPPSLRIDNNTEYSVKSEESESSPSPTPRESRFPLHLVMAEEASRIRSFRERVSSVGSGSQSWTVHVSLLPTSAQPFPFEKDTAAYKRCLSRGLHQVLVIPD